MIEKNMIKVGTWYESRDYGIIMELKSFEPGHELHLGMIKLKLWEWIWTGSLRDFRKNFINVTEGSGQTKGGKSKK